MAALEYIDRVVLKIWKTPPPDKKMGAWSMPGMRELQGHSDKVICATFGPTNLLCSASTDWYKNTDELFHDISWCLAFFSGTWTIQPILSE
jgi:hypothetical protein